MPRICETCEYYDPEGNEEICPECSTALKTTMLGPATASHEDQCQWTQPYQVEYEVLEQPLGMRLSQIGSAIFLYFLIWRFGARFLTFCFGHVLESPDFTTALTVSGLIMLGMYLVAAIFAGMIAGAWTVSWLPQGLGVGFGIFLAPMIFLLIFWPVGLLFSMIVVLFTSLFTVLGAFLGHLLIPPCRIPTA